MKEMNTPKNENKKVMIVKEDDVSLIVPKEGEEMNHVNFRFDDDSFFMTMFIHPSGNKTIHIHTKNDKKMDVTVFTEDDDKMEIKQWDNELGKYNTFELVRGENKDE